MNNPSLIANWNRAFLENGAEGLKEKPKGRPSMTKNLKLESTRKELEREIELLRLENAYLKKLKTFHQNPTAFLEKHKQQWPANSNKKDSN